MGESNYDDPATAQAAVGEGRHREYVGGLWDELGSLQLAFLKAHGLRPHDRFLDVGCGSLRAGVKLIPYLDPGNYWGVDNNAPLLDAGWEHELSQVGLQDRQPRNQLVALGDFEFDRLGVTFDFALAQSVFTHFSWNRIRRCLTRLAPVIKPGGRLFATFFEVPSGRSLEEAIRHDPGGIETHSDRDPYHYRFRDLELAADGLPWRAAYIGNWQHPRGQRIMAFIRSGDPAPSAPESVRRLSGDKVAELAAGSPHYRAFVGPPDRYDFMSATQFSLLFTLGLRESDRVLDFGCGSLRLGRLLIPFLRPGCYWGIEPERWLIDDAVAEELGRGILRIKRPTFSHDDSFDCGVFGARFHYIMAQSILTHTGPDLLRTFLASAKDSLEESGLLVFSYIRADDYRAALPGDGWHYPGCVGYSESRIASMLNDAGLHGRSIPWYHPGAKWMVASSDPDCLPKPSQLLLLRGAVLNEPQFQDSLRLDD
jgi:SAM-dependent methyltransferase